MQAHSHLPVPLAVCLGTLVACTAVQDWSFSSCALVGPLYQTRLGESASTLAEMPEWHAESFWLAHLVTTIVFFPSTGAFVAPESPGTALALSGYYTWQSGLLPDIPRGQTGILTDTLTLETERPLPTDLAIGLGPRSSTGQVPLASAEEGCGPW